MNSNFLYPLQSSNCLKVQFKMTPELLKTNVVKVRNTMNYFLRFEIFSSNTPKI